MKKNKGSLTVEATISLVFFLSIMIIFLLFMKLLVIENALQTTAKEAAKRVKSSLLNVARRSLRQRDDASVPAAFMPRAWLTSPKSLA